MSKKSRNVRRIELATNKAATRIRIAALRITHPLVSINSIQCILADFERVQTLFDLVEFQHRLKFVETSDPEDNHEQFISRTFDTYYGIDDLEHRIPHQSNCYGAPERVQAPNSVPQTFRQEQARLRHVRRGYW